MRGPQVFENRQRDGKLEKDPKWAWRGHSSKSKTNLWYLETLIIAYDYSLDRAMVTLLYLNVSPAVLPLGTW
jgi:hypothetical protein